MDPQFPLKRLVLQAGSVAQDLAFVALCDLHQLFFQEETPEAALIGGQMVTLHAYRWGLGAELFRESRDADTGVTLVGLRDETLLPRIESLGYVRTSGNTFEKPLLDIPVSDGGGNPPAAQIELLAPSYTSRPRESIAVGAFNVTEVPGLAIAMRGTIKAPLRLVRLNNDTADIQIVLPDEVGCLILRAHAWRTRGEDRDALDVWRALEIAHRANIGPEAFHGPAEDAVEIIRGNFGVEDARGMLAIRAGRMLVPSAPNPARIVALVRGVVGQ